MKYVIVGGDELTTNNTKQYQRRVRQEPDHPVKNVETQYGGFHTMMKVAQVISSLFCYPISRFSRTGDGSGSHSQGHFPHHLHSSPSLPLSVSHFSFFSENCWHVPGRIENRAVHLQRELCVCPEPRSRRQNGGEGVLQGHGPTPLSFWSKFDLLFLLFYSLNYRS